MNRLFNEPEIKHPKILGNFGNPVPYIALYSGHF